MLQVESLISHFRWKTIHYRKKPGLCPEPRMPRNSGFEIRSFGVRDPVLRTPPHGRHPSRTSTPAKGRTPNSGRSGIVFEAAHNPASPGPAFDKIGLTDSQVTTAPSLPSNIGCPHSHRCLLTHRSSTRRRSPSSSFYSRAPRTRSFYEDHFYDYRMAGAGLQRRNARWESISIPVCAVFSPPWLASPRRAALDKMGLSNHRNPHFLGQNQPKCSVPKILILRQDRDCPR